MKRYQHTKKDSLERVGFYVALTICLVAVGAAIWSAYASFGEPQEESGGFSSSLSSATAPVGQPMTGVTESATAPTAVPATRATAPPTVAPSQPATQAQTRTHAEYATIPREEDTEQDNEITALQAVLRVTDSLVYPTKSRTVVKQYSEDAVYSKTMGDYRAHTGCDFAAEAGESVYAMCGGTVKDISVSELYGVIVEVAGDGFSVYYCGLDPDLTVGKGDALGAGDTVGAAAQVPCENADPPHIHVEIRVGSRLIDPLSVINTNS